MPFPLSDHCNGKTFFYPGETVARSFLDAFRWKLFSKPTPWPKQVDLPPTSPPPVPLLGQTVATWINHSTVLLQTTQGNFLTDPVFSPRVGPGGVIGPKRVHPPGIRLEELPKIDGILLSHDHYDHCDLPSLKKLAEAHHPVVIAPLGHAALLKSTGLSEVVELDWWQTHAWSADIAITLTPARHWCRRRIGGTNERLWGGFFLQLGPKAIYFAGDSGYDSLLFPRIRFRLGAPDLAFIPIGAYAPRWFMQSSHLNPAEAVQVHADTGARVSVGIHWGTFQLTDEGRDEPPLALERALRSSRLPNQDFRALSPGASVVV